MPHHLRASLVREGSHADRPGARSRCRCQGAAYVAGRAEPLARKPLPKFATAAEEESFWLSHDFDDAMDAGGEEVAYEPQATRRPRTHVYRVRSTTRRSKLQALAKRRGVTASVILRELVRAARVGQPENRHKLLA
jgi:hypothetical protein